MKSSYRFSIIIPTLNEVAFLPLLLEALEKQTFRNFEVIVADGRSEDGTQEAARSFAERLRQLKVITCAKRNAGAQRNAGAKEASGEYLIFFDADVRIPKHFLRGIDRAIRAKKSFLLTTWLAPDTTHEQDQIICLVTNMGIEAATLVERPFAPGCDIIIHRMVFEHVGGFDARLAMSEDHDFVRRCLQAGVKMRVLRKPTLVMSMRRFRKYGYFSIIRTYAKTMMYMVLKKSITKAMVDYPMGGQLYAKSAEKRKDYISKLEGRVLELMQKFLTA